MQLTPNVGVSPSLRLACGLCQATNRRNLVEKFLARTGLGLLPVVRGLRIARSKHRPDMDIMWRARADDISSDQWRPRIVYRRAALNRYDAVVGVRKLNFAVDSTTGSKLGDGILLRRSFVLTICYRAEYAAVFVSGNCSPA